MKQKDLDKIEGYIQRFNQLPKNADWKVKIMWNEETKEGKENALKIIDELDEIFIELRAFIKVKFGEEHLYLKECNSIDFDTKFMGIPVNTNDRNSIQTSWRRGMRSLKSLLKNIHAEILMRMEEEPVTNREMKNEKANQPTQITNSNVIIGNVSQSDLSRNKNSNETQNKEVVPNSPPSKKWQKIGVFVTILIAITTLIINYLINKGII